MPIFFRSILSMSPLVLGDDSPTAPAFSPSDVAGLKLWLKADTQVYTDAGITEATNGQTVQEWHDQSGNNNDFSQATETNKPTLATSSINSLPTVNFDGVDNFLEAGNFDSSAEGTVFVVVRLPSSLGDDVNALLTSSDEATTNDFFMLSPYWKSTEPVMRFSVKGSTITDRTLGATRVFADVPYMTTWNSSGGLYRMWRQGLRQQNDYDLDQISGNGKWLSTVLNRDNFTIGALQRTSTTHYAKMHLAEIIYYSTAPSNADIIRVHQYLADRWGITLVDDITRISSTTTSQTDTHGVALFDSGNKCLTVDRDGNRVDCWDISDKSSPSILSSITASLNKPHYVVISNDEQYAYTVFRDNTGDGSAAKFQVIDISNPNAIAIDNSLTDADFYGGQQVVLDSDNSHAYVAGQDSDKIVVVDISDPTSPSKVGSIGGVGSPNFLQDVAHLAISSDDQVLFASSYGDGYVGAFDISTPASISLRNTINTNLSSPHGLELDSTGNYLFIANMYASNRNQGALVVYDVSNPDSLAYQTRILMDGTSSSNTNYLDYLHEVHRYGNYLYGASQVANSTLAGWGNAITKFNVTDPTAPTVEWSFHDGHHLAGNQETVKTGNYLISACHELAGLVIYEET